MPRNPDADVIIVGAGVAGCAAAATALELGYSVAIIEAGSAGPLPAPLRSPDLNRAADAAAWWWDDPYLAGRGIGGGSAVNGMVVQMPTDRSDEADWVWSQIQPETAPVGPLVDELAAVAGGECEAATLMVRNGTRLTAADLWLQPSEQLVVQARSTVSAEDVDRWRVDRAVFVAAGALRSPGLVGAEAAPLRDHKSAVVEFELPDRLRNRSTDAPVATALLRRGDVQIVVLERAGKDPARGALIVSAMVEDSDGSTLNGGAAHAQSLLAAVGLVGERSDAPAPVAHACCTLTGIDTEVPVIDASTLPELPSVNPMVTVAAHARRRVHSLLS